jgi:hypothetical protein
LGDATVALRTGDIFIVRHTIPEKCVALVELCDGEVLDESSCNDTMVIVCQSTFDATVQQPHASPEPQPQPEIAPASQQPPEGTCPPFQTFKEFTSSTPRVDKRHRPSLEDESLQAGAHDGTPAASRPRETGPIF